jgi:hypothetical protein
MADFEMPEDLKGKSPEDIAKMYLDARSEYEKYKNEWEPRAKTWQSYSELGDPEEIRKVIDWGKTVAAPLVQKIAKGEAYLLNDADYKAYKSWAEKTQNGRSTEVAPSPDDDLFAPVEKRLEEKLAAAMQKLIEDRAKAYDGQIQRGFKALQDQLNLYAHTNKLQRQYPNLDLEAVVKKGAELAQLPADKLLDALIESEMKNSTMEAEIEKRVAAKLAEKQTDDEASRVASLLENRRGGGTLPAKTDNKSAMTQLVRTLGTKYPDIFSQIPLS